MHQQDRQGSMVTSTWPRNNYGQLPLSPIAHVNTIALTHGLQTFTHEHWCSSPLTALNRLHHSPHNNCGRLLLRPHAHMASLSQALYYNTFTSLTHHAREHHNTHPWDLTITHEHHVLSLTAHKALLCPSLTHPRGYHAALPCHAALHRSYPVPSPMLLALVEQLPCALNHAVSTHRMEQLTFLPSEGEALHHTSRSRPRALPSSDATLKQVEIGGSSEGYRVMKLGRRTKMQEAGLLITSLGGKSFTGLGGWFLATNNTVVRYSNLAHDICVCV